MKHSKTPAGADPAPELEPTPDPTAAPEDERAAAEATDLPQADEAEAQAVALAAELAQARDRWLRAEADLQTARRRFAREAEEAERRGFDRALLLLVSFADDLERALQAATQAGEPDGPLAQGVAMVLRRMVESLAAEGVSPIDPLGEPFDPRAHEAMLSVPSPAHPAGTVTEVVARGWRQGGRLLRPARVLVSSGPPAVAEDGGAS